MTISVDSQQERRAVIDALVVVHRALFHCVTASWDPEGPQILVRVNSHLLDRLYEVTNSDGRGPLA